MNWSDSGRGHNILWSILNYIICLLIKLYTLILCICGNSTKDQVTTNNIDELSWCKTLANAAKSPKAEALEHSVSAASCGHVCGEQLNHAKPSPPWQTLLNVRVYLDIILLANCFEFDKLEFGRASRKDLPLAISHHLAWSKWPRHERVKLSGTVRRLLPACVM